MALIQQEIGVIVILCALYILKDTIPKIGKYPSWVSQSIIILVFVGTLWGVVSIVSTFEFISMNKTYRTLLQAIRGPLLGVLVGISLVLGLAGYIGSGASEKGHIHNLKN